MTRPTTRLSLIAALVAGLSPRPSQPAVGARQGPPSCRDDPRHRQFDFWLGDWDVRPRGSNATPARNVITRIHGDCVILETFTAPGYSGQSFNIFDRTRGRWNQTWVDAGGSLNVYWGEVRDGAMYYEGDRPDPRAPLTRIRTRLTFFPLSPDSVRQLSESTRDGGVTWTVNYDLLYTRR